MWDADLVVASLALIAALYEAPDTARFHTRAAGASFKGTLEGTLRG